MNVPTCGHEECNQHVLKLYPDELTATGEVKPVCCHCSLPLGVDRPQMKEGPWSCRQYWDGERQIEYQCEATPTQLLAELEAEAEHREDMGYSDNPDAWPAGYAR